MQVNTAYLIESALYEKVVYSGTHPQNFVPEFQRIYPHMFLEPVEITPEITELDGKRREMVEQMAHNGIPFDDPEYESTITRAWRLFQQEITIFYQANTEMIDGIIRQYRQFLKTKECS